VPASKGAPWRSEGRRLLISTVLSGGEARIFDTCPGAVIRRATKRMRRGTDCSERGRTASFM
jgi:hypothetical protein